MAFNAVVLPGYFAAMRIPLLSGRALDAGDRADGPPVVVVSRALAERYLPGGAAVGRRVTAFGREREIVGIVGDVRHYGPGTPPEPMMYFPHAQDTRGGMTLVLRAAAPPGTLLAAIRGAIRRLDPEVLVTGVEGFGALRADRLAGQRFNALLIGAFAALALTLAGVGLFGVMAFAMAARTREIGVRMALGASGASVRAGMLREALALAATGTALGLAAAFALSRTIRGLLFGVVPGDPLTYAAAAATLLAVAALAAWLPARRATRVDPVEALRQG
jgi:predicted permease